VLDLASASSPRIAVENRRLINLDEMFEHFPNKTLISAVRLLRVALLRPLADWNGTGTPPLRYSPSQNEKFHLDKRPKALKRLTVQWASLEPLLVAVLPTLDAADRMRLFVLIAKGYSLFQTRKVESPCSFGELARECMDAGLLPPPIREQVAVMDQAVLPDDKAGFLRLKSFVHAVVDVPRHRRCRLKTGAIEHLDKICPEVVHSLPGYKPKPPQPIGARFHFMFDSDPKHSDQLHSLIDHTVFQRFRFIRRVD
jgi:hypothetical protein